MEVKSEELKAMGSGAAGYWPLANGSREDEGYAAELRIMD